MLKPILLVDDDAHDRELTCIALGRASLLNETIAVRDGEEALDYLFRRGSFASREPGNPAVVLLDMKMPKVDGLDVLRYVRANSETEQIPIVMLTGSREEQDLVKSYELGVNAFVVKPLDFQDFVQAVAKVGAFWAVVNEPPAGSLKYVRPLA